MAIWFEGTDEIDCDFQDVKEAVDDPGELFTAVTGHMPGMTSVELVEQGTNHVTIRTSEGLMTRTNISKHIDAERVVLEFDEQYDAGSTVTATSHFVEEFTVGDRGVAHRLVITDLEAPGVLGFFYRKLGSNRIGAAFLAAYRTHFETQDE